MEINQNPLIRYDESFGFAVGFRLSMTTDVSQFAKQVPQSVVLCTPRIIAGNQHVFPILSQSHESAKRGILLARNRSIDLLMRITCRSQISEAIIVSEISKTDRLAIFGFVKDESEIDAIHSRLRDQFGEIERKDSLLLLTKEKAKFLKQLHKLPSWLNDDQLFVALKERSALLVLDR